MTSENARFVYDLRGSFASAVAYDADPPADTSTDAGPPGGPQGDEDGTGADVGSSATASTSADEEGSARIKALSDEAAKHRHRAKNAEASLATANDTIRDLRIEVAFIRAALPLIADTDAAWKLADHSLIKVDEEGNVTGVDDTIQTLLRSYPYLERIADTTPPLAPGSGGSPSNGRRTKNNTADLASLIKKFPALRNR